MKQILLFLAVAALLDAQAYRFGHVWDGEKVLPNAVIVVENGHIKSVGPASGESIDMTKYTAIPGLIDVHTHMTYVLDMSKICAGRARRGDGLPLAGQREEDARDRRDHGPQSGREQLRRHRHARSDQRRPDDRPAHVRLGLRPANHARWTRRAGNGRWSGGGDEGGPPADRRRRGRDQDVRIDRIGSGCHRRPDLHL